MKRIFTNLLLISPCLVFAQARLVLNNDPYIVMNSGTIVTPIYIVLANPATNAITLSTAQVNGGIKTESEFNMIKWNIGTTTGSYTVPYTKATGGPIIPFTAQITTAGIGAGNLKFSTYPGSTWDNNTYKPSDVSNMTSAWAGGANNSAKVIDRFWIIDANGYTTKPVSTFAFTYVDAEWSVASNTITEANLAAQRFDPTVGIGWNGYTPQGTANTPTNTVTAVPVIAADFFRSWTLVDKTSPLPIELIKYEATCKEKNIVVEWTTASETNNNYFNIEKSIDGTSFVAIGIVNGAGNNNGIINYSFTDYNPNSGTNYYRLKQTDYNGDSKSFDIISTSNCDENNNVIVFNNQQGSIDLSINSESSDNYIATLYDAIGKKIINKQFSIEKGSNNFQLDISLINSGIYFMVVENGKKRSIQKILIN